MSAKGRPLRIQSAHVESIGGELCVYDTAHQRVHSLNATAAFVWQRCDGRTTAAELAEALSAETAIDDAAGIVGLTLRELSDAKLLAVPVDDAVQVSRRDLLRRGVAAAAVPAIYSIVAPRPAAAQSAPSGTEAFAFSGAPETFVVPAGVTSITIEAVGAAGGSGVSNTTVGLGGSVTATVSVTPGATLTVLVGGVGPNGVPGVQTIVGGFNGGGTSVGDGGGGGGASSVHNGATPLVIAGGGGGAGAPTGPIGSGGDGGGLTGDPGGTVPSGGGGGGGGTQAAGGAGGAASATGTAGTAGVAGTGGIGGSQSGTPGFFGGGGGGGGRFGGGGGGGGAVDGGGGGGGSSFTAPGATSVVHAQGANTGDGSVTITW